MGQKALQFFYTEFIIFNLLDQKPMQIILFIILMWQDLKKLLCLFCLPEFLCISSKYRNSHSYH